MKVFVIAMCSILSIAAGIFTSTLVTKNDQHAHADHQYKNQVDVHAIYPKYTPEELVNIADVVVYGKVKSKEKAKKHEFKIKKETENKTIDYIKTGVEIEVIESIKNKEEKKVINYQEDGGTLDNITYVPDEGLLEKGEEVIIFLNEEGNAWGPQSVLRVEKDQVTTDITKNNKDQFTVESVKYDKDEFIKELKSYKK